MKNLLIDYLIFFQAVNVNHERQSVEIELKRLKETRTKLLDLVTTLGLITSRQ